MNFNAFDVCYLFIYRKLYNSAVVKTDYFFVLVICLVALTTSFACWSWHSRYIVCRICYVYLVRIVT